MKVKRNIFVIFKMDILVGKRRKEGYHLWNSCYIILSSTNEFRTGNRPNAEIACLDVKLHK